MMRIRIAFWFAYGLSFWTAIFGGIFQSPARIVAGVIGEICSSLIYLGVKC